MTGGKARWVQGRFSVVGYLKTDAGARKTKLMDFSCELTVENKINHDEFEYQKV